LNGLTTRPTATTEKRVKNIPDTSEVIKTHTERGSRASMTKLIVVRTLFRVTKHLMSLIDLFESSLSIRLLTNIGVMPPGQIPKRFSNLL
jgi:hypothetical protein